MIFTVTLNPAIDRTIILDHLERGCVNRAGNTRSDIGGKGINVSKVLKSLGVKSTASGFLGKENAHAFLDYLEVMDIFTDFYILDGEVRTNIKIIETDGNVCTDINETGLTAEDSDAENFTEGLLKNVRYGDVVVLSGSIPVGISKDIYGKMIYRLNKKGVLTILDGDREVLSRGIEGVPYGIKPNIRELKFIADVNENDINSIINGGRSLNQKGIKEVMISMGNKGALYITDESCLYARPFCVEVKSTVGAGDAMVAALAYSIENKLSDIETIKLACACASASVMTDGTQSPGYDLISELVDKVKVEQYT